jgi:beta-propeller repeat-containing protein
LKAPTPGLDGPGGIALDPNGNIYVTNGYFAFMPSFFGSVTVYPAPGPFTIPDEAPTAAVSGGRTLLYSVKGIAIGPFVP